VSAQRTVKHWITSADELHAVALELLSSRWTGGTPVRLVGIGLSNLAAVETQDQMELFSDTSTRRGRVEEAVFRLQQKMGDGTLTKASLMRPESRHPESKRPGFKRKPPGPGSDDLPGPTSP
jgi:impB/mucB/samB family C-terminal domain